MKTIITIFVSVFSTLCFSQKNDKIYILVDKNSEISTFKTQNDSLEVEIFQLKFGQNNIKYDFKKDSIGNLQKSISLKGGGLKIIELEYKNSNNDNSQFLISGYKHLNYITYDEIANAKDFDKIINLIRSYNKIFIMDKDYRCNTDYIVKKIILKSYKSDL